MIKKMAIGHRGSWFATVEGERLPCVHKHWVSKGFEYDDPGYVENAQFCELVDGLRDTGKAMLTTDEVLDGGKAFNRTGYIAVFAIENVRVEDGRLRFKFTERLEDLQ